MGSAVFASLALWTLASSAWHDPSRCPYCPGDPAAHWIGWGHYKRYAADRNNPRRLIDVPRYWCPYARRTFSLLPDSLLPYHGWRTAHILQLLHAMFVRGVAANRLIQATGLGRRSLRSLKARFLRALPKLRLPGHEGALSPAAFLLVLADMEPAAVAELFRGWKEREPKHSVVGIYLRC